MLSAWILIWVLGSIGFLLVVAAFIWGSEEGEFGVVVTFVVGAVLVVGAMLGAQNATMVENTCWVMHQGVVVSGQCVQLQGLDNE